MAGQTEQAITKSVEALTGQSVEAVRKSGMADLYEVVTPRGILYADSTGQFVIFGGTVVDSKTKENLSAKRLAEISKFSWNELPFKDAIKLVRGTGKRVIATVEDPNCGYCKKFAPELNKLNDVTIYTFVVPMLGPDSVRKAKAIWCSPDRQAAWSKQMSGTFVVEGEPKCETPGARLADWAQKVRVQGTPTVLFADGSRIPGFATADVLERKLKDIHHD
jgi:thiol:disulfide interchange protein DsbC